MLHLKTCKGMREDWPPHLKTFERNHHDTQDIYAASGEDLNEASAVRLLHMMTCEEIRQALTPHLGSK